MKPSADTRPHLPPGGGGRSSTQTAWPAVREPDRGGQPAHARPDHGDRSSPQPAASARAPRTRPSPPPPPPPPRGRRHSTALANVSPTQVQTYSASAPSPSRAARRRRRAPTRPRTRPAPVDEPAEEVRRRDPLVAPAARPRPVALARHPRVQEDVPRRQRARRERDPQARRRPAISPATTHDGRAIIAHAAAASSGTLPTRGPS